MAIRDSFPVTVADGDQLNDGYFNGMANDTRHLVTRAFSNNSSSTTSSSMQDYLTLNTPTTLKANQVVFINAVLSVYGQSGDVGEYELWDDTAGVQIVSDDHDSYGYPSSLKTLMLQGTVTISSASSSKSIQIRFRRVSGSSGSVSVQSASVTCMLVES
jgi:hypothetical protein